MTPVINRTTISADQVAKLRSTVKRRSSRVLSAQDVEDVEDVVQQILLDAHIAATKSTFPLAQHAFVMATRPRYYQRPRDAALAAAAMRRFDETDENGAPRFEASVADVIVKREVRDIVGRIDPVLRRILLVCDCLGLTVEEASTRLGVPKSTVHRRLMAARTQFRAAWTQAA